MKPLKITNIQRGCVYDGPGIRTTVFMKGCTLHCPWCSNPETIYGGNEWFVDDQKCLLLQGVHSKLCCSCERNNGYKSIKECPFGVSEATSKDYDIETIEEYLLRDLSLYSETNGGVTFSGGEPLLQAKGLVPLLCRLKKKKINIAFETTLTASIDDVLLVLPYVDIWIVDLKIQPQMMLNSNSYIKRICMCLSLISHKSILYRMVFVDELSDVKLNVLKNLSELSVSELEVLLCHNLGYNKYMRLSIPNKDYTANKLKAESFVKFLIENNVTATLLSV